MLQHRAADSNRLPEGLAGRVVESQCHPEGGRKPLMVFKQKNNVTSWLSKQDVPGSPSTTQR